ncbi:MAG: OmpH family outer membrane protein [Acidobacteria bacterium]|nr:OmpH family outer membrane protein [Acidobacteriota bacterium]MBI1983033.1 OmpH family outer membrane protein [Acidobacteriota bacterium]
MRNRVFTITGVLGLLLVPVLARAQAPAASGGKVGVIALQEAIGATAEGKKAFEDLQKKYEPRRQDLQRQQQEITALQDQLQRQAATLSDDERVRLSRDLEDKQKVFKRATEDANADFQADNQDTFRRLAQKMVRILNEYARQNGFVLIVDQAQIPVYYVADEIDLTEEMVKRYDAANPVAAAASTPATGSATSPAAATATKPATQPK